jgi:glycosyltransferase involved in cell wall biosynthesis
MPRVSVIISTYNWSSVLPYSVGSVLRQQYSDWELIVVGDGCTDDSETVVMKTANGDERVRFVNLPENCGEQSGPNNEGLRQARGELIAYLGHDDLWLPHHLSCLVEAMDAGADVAYTIIRTVYPEGFTAEKELKNLLRRPPSRFLPSSAMHRRSVTERIGGWRGYKETAKPPQDDLLQRALDAGFRCVPVPRMSVVKLPAKDRRDVYKERPSHEQAAWFERIGSTPDLEATELAKMLLIDQRVFYPHAAAPRSALQKAADWLRYKIRPRSRQGALIDSWRAYKGLEPKS